MLESDHRPKFEDLQIAMHLRKLLNQTLRRFGYELSKIDRFREVIQAEYEKRGEFPFVQIGANDGVSFDSLYEFVCNRKSRGVVVEPLPRFFKSLEKNYEGYPSIKPVQCAIHPSEESATIYYVDPKRESEVPEFARGIGSFLPDHFKKSGIPEDLIVTEEVPCRPLMALVEEESILDASLLQIDVEGFDYEVLKMIDFGKFRPPIIKYEHEGLSEEEQKAAQRLLEGEGYEIQIIKTDTVGILEKE